MTTTPINDPLTANILQQLNKINERFDEIDKRFDEIDKRLDKIEERLDKSEERFEKWDTRLWGLTIGLISTAWAAIFAAAGVVIFRTIAG